MKKPMFLKPTRLVEEVLRAVDLFLTSYYYYLCAVDAKSYQAALDYLALAKQWAKAFGERAECTVGKAILLTAYDQLERALKEKEELEKDFLEMVEQVVHEALTAYILQKTHEKHGE